jgi:hypothetical protein
MPNMDKTIAYMEGQTLYAMYARKCAERDWDVKDAAGLTGAGGDRPPQWKHLPEPAKDFWQELANDFAQEAS